ncbi:MAG: DegT/DnrJ/EryC1/StrS family aminotransferase [Candidatus Parvarchaeota archaeon]
MKNPIYVTKPFLPKKKTLNMYINEIYLSRRLTNHGTLVRELEQKLKEYFQAKNVILVANGTLALQIAYKSMNIKGKAITTPFSFVATTSSLVWEGIKPIFADIDPKKLTIDPEKIRKAIDPTVTGIVPVHVYGNACDIERIKEISDEYGLNVVYDAAHAFGVKYRGKNILNYGDASIISFHATKLFHTIEGGAIVTQNDDIAHRARLMRDFGIADIDKVEDIGINAKMNEFEAAMGLSILGQVGKIIAKRKAVWREYHDLLDGYVEFPELTEGVEWNYSYVPILLKDESQLLKLVKVLEEKAIYPRRYFYPSLDTLPYITERHNSPISRNISERVLCLPTYSEISTEEVDNIARTIKMEVRS